MPMPVCRNTVLFPVGFVATMLALAAVPRAQAQVAEKAAMPADRDGTLLAYSGRVVPPMVGPKLPDPDSVASPPAEPRQWDHALPFYAQRVIDRGIDLPNPYDIGLSFYSGREDRKLSSLQVGFNGGAPLNASFVQFPNTRVETQSMQMQAGAWIFPFLNAYGIFGYTKGRGDIDIAMSGQGLMDFLGVPGCNLGPALRPALCSQTLTGTAHAHYEGPSAGLGITVAGAHRNLFFAMPITYVETHVSMSDTPSKTWNLAPRIGYNQHLGPQEVLTWYTGGTYMKSDFNITGTFTFDTSASPIGKLTTMSYSINVRPKDNWNYLAGVNWTINKRWGLMAEVGFGGSRQDLLFNGFYRF